jgi:HAE1 family hydrophobic/amphiphilic exporter-1
VIRGKIEAYFENNPLPESYFYKFGGSIEDMSEMKNDMIFIMVLIILLVYMVMAAQFESFSHPLAIMVSVPLAFIGAALALLITGNSLSVMSAIGIMMLIGIVVNNGIVLIDYVNQLRAKGMEKHAAIKQAGVDRLRPILMTTLTTSLALTPMAVSAGEGAALFAPIAITIFGGLLTSTFLTLVIVPAVYSLIDGASERLSGFVRGLSRN